MPRKAPPSTQIGSLAERDRPVGFANRDLSVGFARSGESVAVADGGAVSVPLWAVHGPWVAMSWWAALAEEPESGVAPAPILDPLRSLTQ